MAMIVAASSLYHSLKDLEQEERRKMQQKVYAVPGLSLNPNTLNRGKDLRVLLELQTLAIKQIIIWHDVLNNSISSHRTNNYTPAHLTNYWRIYNQSEDKLVALSTAGERALPMFLRICGRQR